MSEHFLPYPELRRPPNRADEYFYQLFDYVETFDPSPITTNAIMNSDSLREVMQDSLREGASFSAAMVMTRLLHDRHAEIPAAHNEEVSRDRLLLQPALTYTGLALRQDTADRILQINNFDAFVAALAEVQIVQDSPRAETIASGLTALTSELCNQLYSAEMATEEGTIIDHIFDEKVPAWALGFTADKSDLEAHAKAHRYISLMLPKLGSLNVDLYPRNSLKLYQQATQEGMATHWALLYYAGFLDTEGLIGNIVPGEEAGLYDTIQDIGNKTGRGGKFVQGLRRTWEHALAYDRYSAGQEVDDSIRCDKLGRVQEVTTAINALIPPTETQ